MAEIKGVTLKGITNFKGHEGDPCKQGSIYCNGKKVGYYSDSFTMGAPEIRFDNKDVECKVEQACKTYFKENPNEKWFSDFDGNLEAFFVKLMELIDYEKQYKKYLKQGYPVFATYENKEGLQYMAGYKTIETAKQKLENKEDIIKPKIYKDISEFIAK